MKALGIVRKIDELGRIVIPKEVRDTQGWKSGQAVEMFMGEEGMVIRAYRKNEEKEKAIKLLQDLVPSMNNDAAAQILSALAILEN